MLDAALASYPGLAALSGRVGIVQVQSADPSTPTVRVPAEQLAAYAGRYATELQALEFTATDSGLEVTEVPVMRPDLWQPDIPPPDDASGLPPVPVTFAAEDEALGLGLRLPFVRDASGQVGWVGIRLRLLPRQGAA